MFVHVVDINLPEQRSNVPLEGNWHFLSPFLTSSPFSRPGEHGRRRPQATLDFSGVSKPFSLHFALPLL